MYLSYRLLMKFETHELFKRSPSGRSKEWCDWGMWLVFAADLGDADTYVF